MRRPGREVLVRGLHALRKAALWWALGVAFFGLVTVGFWPSFEGSDALASLGDMSEGLLEAFGAQDIATPAGYLDGQMFALMLPLLLTGMAVATATLLTAGDEEAGRLELLHALPLRRRSIWLGRFAAAMLALGAVTTTTAVLMAVSLRPFSLEEVGIGQIVVATYACALLAAFHAAVGYALAGLGRSRGAAAGGAALVAMIGYLASFVLPLARSLVWARRLSPWHWSIGEQPVSDGVEPVGVVLVALATVALVALGTAAVERRDIRSA